MKIIIMLTSFFFMGCASTGSSVLLSNSVAQCRDLGFVSETGKSNSQALKNAKEKVYFLGGNVLKPENGGYEIGLAHSVNGKTSTHSIYTGKAYHCANINT